jgi:hypothetical protein
MSKGRQDRGFGTSGKRRQGGPRTPDRQRHAIALTQQPPRVNMPEDKPVSAVVIVSEKSRAQYPWLPRCVIVGSVWRGPGNERVRIDDQGQAKA